MSLSTFIHSPPKSTDTVIVTTVVDTRFPVITHTSTDVFSWSEVARARLVCAGDIIAWNSRAWVVEAVARCGGVVALRLRSIGEG